MPAPSHFCAGTASQLIPGVRRTWKAAGMTRGRTTGMMLCILMAASIAHGQGVDNGIAFAPRNLQQAHLFLEVVHGVGFEVDADDGFPPQCVGQTVEFGRGVDDVVEKRSVRRHFLLDPLSPFS